MVELAKRIASLRKEAGMTQQQLAELCGIERANISRMENGRSIGLNNLIKVAKALGKRVDIV